MSRQYHDLKCDTEYYQAVERGKKKFEVRKNDRNFKVYDMVTLHEYVNGVYTGRKISIEIQYILAGGKFGIDKDYCVFCW